MPLRRWRHAPPRRLLHETEVVLPEGVGDWREVAREGGELNVSSCRERLRRLGTEGEAGASPGGRGGAGWESGESACVLCLLPPG